MKHIIFIVFSLSSFGIFAQDIMITTASQKINAEIIEVGPNEIRYKRFDNLEGPTYVILKSDIVDIIYKDGTVEALQNSVAEKTKPEASAEFITGMFSVRMGNREKMDFLHKHDRKLYREFKVGQIYGWMSGAVAVTGAGIMAGGFAGLKASSQSKYHGRAANPEGVVLSSLVVSAGALFMVTSITFGIISSNKRKHATRVFMEKYQSYNYSPSMDVGLTSNGVGLVLNF
ncbi:MAG: hypothetical protein LBQ31_11375 [Bacteroidales bacterium]|jgi:hypothetical protein|nr:hypothetical protein [Bacteroidales bacterium]